MIIGNLGRTVINTVPGLPAMGHKGIYQLAQVLVSLDEQISPDSLADRAAISRETTRRSLRFLSELGWLECQNGLLTVGLTARKRLSKIVKGDEVTRKIAWQDSLAGCRLARNILNQVSIETTLSRKDLISSIAGALNLSLIIRVNTGISCIIDLMISNDLLCERDNTISLSPYIPYLHDGMETRIVAAATRKKQDGLNFKDFLHEWMSDITAGSPSTTELGRRFSTKIVSQWLDVNFDDDSEQDLVYCDGASDGGIDIAYLQRAEPGEDGESDGGTWYIVQSKYGKSFQGEQAILTEGRKIINTLKGTTKLSSPASHLVQRLKYFIESAAENDKIIVVLATESPLNESQQAALEDLQILGRESFGPLFDVQAISIETIFAKTANAKELGGSIVVSIGGNLMPNGEGLLVGTVGLIDLYEFLKYYKRAAGDLDNIFEKNVRKYLGSRRKINKSIQDTLKNEPESFGLYNNGITIVVKDIQKGEKGYTLTDPFIVNGCQTTRTLWEVCNQRLDNGATGSSQEQQVWKQKAEMGVVVTKVVKVGPIDDLLTKITRFTNSQNAIKDKDFIALDNHFSEWKSGMETKYQVYLEIQRGGWDAYKAANRARTQRLTQYANAFDLLKIYGAGWLQEPGSAYGRNASYAPGGQAFQRILTAGANGDFGIDELYACFLMQRLAEHEFGRSASLPSRKASKYVFYYVFVELLKRLLERKSVTLNASRISHAIISMLDNGSLISIKEMFFDVCLQMIDEYFTETNEKSAFKESSYQNNIVTFLKSDQLTYGELLRSLTGDYLRLMTLQMRDVVITLK